MAQQASAESQASRAPLARGQSSFWWPHICAGQRQWWPGGSLTWRTSAGLSLLAQLTKLTGLDLGNAVLAPEYVGALQQCSTLTALADAKLPLLCSAFADSPASMLVLTAWPQLQSLRLCAGGPHPIGPSSQMPAAAARLLSRLSCLTRLEIPYPPKLAPEALNVLLTSAAVLPRLRHLDLTGWRFSQQLAATFALCCASLSRLVCLAVPCHAFSTPPAAAATAGLISLTELRRA
jgi:hypothetical protein